jgi:hypothetical protein
MASAAAELVRQHPEVAAVPIRFVAASGVMSTCYRPPRTTRRRPVHVVQFGSRMAALQLTAPLGSDTSGREMRRHGWAARYGDTPRARMACIVAHEVAHLLDHLSNGHGPRRAHGPEFRQVLLALHANGSVASLIEWMRRQDPDGRLDRPVAAAPLPPGATRRRARPPSRRPAHGFARGDRVAFAGPDGTPRLGTVLRLNRKTVSVHEDGAPATRWWRIPPRLLAKMRP